MVGGCIRDNRGAKRVLELDSATVVAFAAAAAAAVGEAVAGAGEQAAEVAASVRI